MQLRIHNLELVNAACSPYSIDAVSDLHSSCSSVTASGNQVRRRAN